MSADLCIPEPPPSACGDVQEGGLYLRGAGGGAWGGGENGTDYLFTAIWPAAGDDSGIVTAAKTRTVPRVVDMDAVLAYAPEQDWLIAQSRSNWLAKNWEQLEVQVFGMPAKERLGEGILEDITTVKEAQEFLQALRPNPAHWQNAGRTIHAISRQTVEKERLHSAVLQAYKHWQQGVPFLVLARMHELYRRCRAGDEEIRQRVLTVIEYLAPEDRFWLQLENTTYALDAA